MRGATFFSYALVALTVGVTATPADVDEKREAFDIPGLALAAKIGTVNDGKMFEARDGAATDPILALPAPTPGVPQVLFTRYATASKISKDR
ncbi:hypothetical protein MBM_04344 [Drepanopeziza brunnea f. sp. 'multigermtubi' MB_m1]|uniref:Uncharacterized protein n=1 Tax=Marssonina brunnea f. sp. multigermtubi (strain MB_m1) TaxID=1072389 RepID=K1X9T3_MARBU|nr:uncharacterized protein MBM_04344 [Drepanopeziza brunnea f. sp. 'multigermtubi' MB_m1]EKD17483.1 hypothetical protein MBM_04344 [Drepanopeziza brunnea f. sp. 'multigermtubi' MB_m1]